MDNFKLGNGSFNAILAFVVVTSFFLFFFSSFSITGNATEGSTTSNVTIAKYLAITFGTNLSEGIQFGSVSTLPATSINASHNHDGASNATTYTVEVHNDSNTAVDFCIRANAGLTSAALDVIGLANETYSALNLTNSTHPILSNETPMTVSYVKAVSAIPPGNSSYWRFWLDIPASQPSGNYNNSVFFEGVTTGLAC